MAHYEQRKLLEQLMGSDSLIRLPKDYGEENEDSSVVLNDPRVCRSFVVGTCPYTLFSGTKGDIGTCPKLHMERHRILYESLRKEGTTLPDYERQYLSELRRYIDDCDYRIKVALARLEHTPEERAQLSDVTRSLDDLSTKIGIMTQEIEQLAQTSPEETTKLVIESRKLQETCDERDRLGKQYAEMLDNLGQAAQQKLQVCEVCAAYLSRLDSDRRLADHFVGKIHLGYLLMRTELERLQGVQRQNNK
ncbi:U1 snRNP complex associated protein [Komagataella phaffii CBS 7435]|uniref:Essential protein associated with the U1 snRNP complex n=2 Tax=Komagataella phaffii TaxID=460519 RepID=C4QVN7_KOMPG|nr:Essential protein associated with the U1 snRNP complex [Komagataella phaffii GS115]AOA60755.1 GQ67_02510T0 [Komagataella phaffii]CAH2445967.1 U1 snRNP complex associated protein [Komagataella phaffii CBS 7435]AOA66739.1 GQ68_02737T0 [Komagataella phaffii GS115]CAY67310.1 Essential protein associated with the U1 snRNP complex [Komagataella phaffii GS115]CCA36414.1 U1 snRNP complex associated protein [Komagataella phaffii CBS 7435]